MKRNSKRMLSSLLALIMVLSVMTVPVLANGTEDAITLPDPLVYEWNFNNSSINPNVSPVNGTYGYKGNYDAATQKIVDLPYSSYTDTTKLKDFIIGGENDSYLQAGNGNGYVGTIELVNESSDNKVLRITHGPDTTGYPFVSVKFPSPLKGELLVEFEARVRKLNTENGTISALSDGRLHICTVNGFSNSGSPWMALRNGDGVAVVNHNYASKVSCNQCSTANSANTIATGTNDGTMKKFKMKLDYTGDTAYANIYKDGAAEPVSHNDHPIKYQVSGTGLESINFQISLNSPPTLAESEALIYDIDNIKVTPIPAAPIADVANGAVGVDIRTEKFTVDFNTAVNDDVKNGVKLLDSVGNNVAAATADGTKVYVAPTTDLNPQSKYTLVIPAVKVSGVEYAKQEIEFYTAKDYALGSMNFNSTLADRKAVMDEVTKEFAGKVTAEAGSVGTVGKVGAENGVLYLQTSTTGTAVTGSYLNLDLAEAADELFHAEFIMDMSNETAKGYYPPVEFYSGNTSIGRFRVASNSLYFYDGKKDTALLSSALLVGKLKYIVDIDTTTGNGTCKVVNPVSGVGVSSCAFTITASPVTKVRFIAYGRNDICTSTEVIDGTTHYINRVELDDILIADMPISEAKFVTPTVGVEAGDTPEIEFNYPIEDASKLELYVGETKVEDAVFTLSPDGYTVTVDADFAEDTEYTVKLDAVTTTGGGALSGSIGFLTAPKAPQFTIDANVYAKADTEFATPLAGLTADEEVAVVVDVTNNENTVAFDTIVYVGVYTEGGNLLIATATEENFKPGTAELTSSFKVPANAHHIKVFAWDKYLTPYCVPTELFNN